MDDPFIRNYIEDLLSKIRTQVLLKLIKPYTRIRIPFISKVTPCMLFSFMWCNVNKEGINGCYSCLKFVFRNYIPYWTS
jgi:hypothetical protein